MVEHVYVYLVIHDLTVSYISTMFGRTHTCI